MSVATFVLQTAMYVNRSPRGPKGRIGEVSTPAVLADLPYLAHQQPNVLDYWKAGFWVFKQIGIGGDDVLRTLSLIQSN